MDQARRAWVDFGIEVLFNFVLPYLIYVEAQPAAGRVHALLAASLPPIIWSLVQFARSRQVDVLAILVLVGIVLSLLAFLGGGSVRFLQLRENLVTGLIGLAFLGSVVIGRPLIYELSRATLKRTSPAQAARLATLRVKAPAARRRMTVMTVVWGFALIGQTAVACVLVFRLSIRQYLVVGPIVSYALLGVFGLWTVWYAGRARRRTTAGVRGQGAGTVSPEATDSRAP